MAAQTRQHVCPICARDVPPRDGTPKNPAFPFCSSQCKLVDLGKWLDGTYRVPAPFDSSSDDDGNAREGETVARNRRDDE